MNLPSILQGIIPSVVALGRYPESLKRSAHPPSPLVAGAGCVVDEDGLIVTSRHILEELERWPSERNFVAFFCHSGSDPEFRNGQGSSAVVFRRIIRTFWPGSFTPTGRSFGEPDTDLVFAAVNVRGLPALQVRAAADSLQPGVEVVRLGFAKGCAPHTPRGEDPSWLHPFARRGIISSVLPCPCERPQSFTVDIPNGREADGSPVFAAEDGALLGILNAAYEEAPVTFGLPGHLIASGIAAVRELWQPNPELPLLAEVFQAQAGLNREAEGRSGPTDAVAVQPHELTDYDEIRRFIQRERRH